MHQSYTSCVTKPFRIPVSDIRLADQQNSKMHEHNSKRAARSFLPYLSLFIIHITDKNSAGEERR
jgi:hypothetical protein